VHCSRCCCTQGTSSAYIIACVVVNKFARGKSGWNVIPHANFFREMGGLIADGVAFTLAGFKVPGVANESLLRGSTKENPATVERKQLAQGEPPPAAPPVDFAALVKSGQVKSLATSTRLADDRCATPGL
jgi:hypothetical protein